MAVIRILHASDLHIAEIPDLLSPADHFSAGTFFDLLRKRTAASSYNKQVLQCFADLAWDQASRNSSSGSAIDAVMLTGDIATTGLPRDLEVAQEFLNSPPWLPFFPTRTWEMEPTLAGLKVPVWILPGNHDRYQMSLKSFYEPGGEEFDQYFEGQWRGPVMVYDPPLKQADCVVRLIGADFNLLHGNDRQGKWYNQLAQGKVYAHILTALVRETRKVRAQHSAQHNLAVVWAIHFPPGYPCLSKAMRLLQEETLVEMANRYGVAAILAGHTHEAVRYRTPGMHFDVFCAGTVSQRLAEADRSGNHCQILNFRFYDDATCGIELENYLFNREQSAFLKV